MKSRVFRAGTLALPSGELLPVDNLLEEGDTPRPFRQDDEIPLAGLKTIWRRRRWGEDN